eukprot:7821262-Alexandrium_andersonii.AAC.1
MARTTFCCCALGSSFSATSPSSARTPGAGRGMSLWAAVQRSFTTTRSVAGFRPWLSARKLRGLRTGAGRPLGSMAAKCCLQHLGRAR